ncbi:MAG: lipid A deacylase LpxR family protein [Ginsengibacter sp.]
MRFNIFFLLFFCLFTNSAISQLIDCSSTFKSKSNAYFCFHYDNDYFTKTDEYYSQGIALELVHPAVRKLPVTKLLVKSKSSEYKYGILINHFVYTPTSISSDEILYGDRPFSANVTISSFVNSKDTLHHRLISSSITIGIIGQAAGGKEIQQTIHRWLNNRQPHGWQNQIQNDMILTYQVNYEKRLVNLPKKFLLNIASDIKLGTHTDNLKAGFNFMAGKFNDPYQPAYITHNNRKKIKCYLYGQVQPGITFYDATLKGGLFNISSPYTIPVSEIKHFTIQADYGIVLSFRKIYLEYRQSILTKEFSYGHYHRWGGISIGVDL